MPGTALALLLALLPALACAGPPPQPPDWAGSVAGARLGQAIVAEQEGDRARAEDLGERALAEARSAAHLPVIARAQLLLGRLAQDPARLRDALAAFLLLGDRAGEVQARLELAELSLASHRAESARQQVLAVAGLLAHEAEADLDARIQRAALEARMHHVHAGALRQLGRDDEAFTEQRRARLVLSLLGDEVQVPLRLAIAAALGDDLARRGQPDEALGHHSRASDLARMIGDVEAELAALLSMVTDLDALARLDAAADHCLRAMRLAETIPAPERAADLARLGLDLLERLGEVPGTRRAREFQTALVPRG